MAMLAKRLNRIAPWRFLLFVAILIIVGLASWRFRDASQALLIGFDAAAILFLLSYVPAFGRESTEMRRLSAESDAGRTMLLVVTFVLSAVVLVAIVAELGLRGSLGLTDKLLIVLSLLLAWMFGNAIYTLHYAHLYYQAGLDGKDCGGLAFPGTPEPLMSDFVYFAFTLGVAVQTSDVQVTSRRMRKIVTVHSVIGFFFNLGVLALAISLLGAG
jgi:uncharacterized membrane protein